MKLRDLALTSAAGAFLFVAACHKKVPVAQTPPPPRQQTAAQEPARNYTPATAEPAYTPEKQTASTMPDAATRARIQDLLNRIEDAYFDYDKHDIRPDAQKALVDDAHTLADILRQYPDYKLTVEGYCDERGSDEYNIALGDARAKQAKDYLVNLGIPADQLRTVSYGRERPVCTEHDENCWQKNRRAHITQEQS